MKKLFSSQSGVAHIFLLLILLVGLGVGFYLVNYTQTNLKPKASESEEFVRFYNLDDPEGKNPTTEITGNEGMYIEVVKLPNGWVWPEEKSSSLFPIVNAQEAQEDSKCPIDESCCLKPLKNAKCASNDECVVKNPDYGWCYGGYCIKNDYREGENCVIATDKQVPASEKPDVQSTNEQTKSGSEQVLNKIRIVSTGIFGEVRRGDQGFGAGKKIKIKVLSDFFQGDFRRMIPLEVKFTSDNGSEQTIKTSIILKSKSNNNTSVTISPIIKDAPDLPDIDESQLMIVPVEVFIHTSLDYGLASSIANNAINYRMNPLLKKAGKKLKITNTSSISHNRCPDASCKLPPKTIGLYMYAQGSYFKTKEGELGVAHPWNMQAGVMVNPLDRTVSENTMIHEILHIFNLPDYYEEGVSRNEVSSDFYTFGSYNQDVMSGASSSKNPIISNVSLHMVKGITSLPVAIASNNRFMGDVLAWSYTPNNLIIKVIRNPGDRITKAHDGALVEVFPQIVKDGQYIISREEKSFSGVTDAEGKISLGNYTNYMGYGRSAFIKISKDGKTTYRPITRSELNKLFLEGKISNAEIEIILY